MTWELVHNSIIKNRLPSGRDFLMTLRIGVLKRSHQGRYTG